MISREREISELKQEFRDMIIKAIKHEGWRIDRSYDHWFTRDISYMVEIFTYANARPVRWRLSFDYDWALYDDAQTRVDELMNTARDEIARQRVETV